MSISGPGGQGISDLDRFALILHSRRVAWLNAHTQNSQSLPPNVPGRIISSSAVRTNLGADTNEDEAWLIVPDMLPIAEGPVVVLASEQLAGSLPGALRRPQAFATGFGRAPLSICRIAGTSMVAPSL